MFCSYSLKYQRNQFVILIEQEYWSLSDVQSENLIAIHILSDVLASHLEEQCSYTQPISEIGKQSHRDMSHA